MVNKSSLVSNIKVSKRKRKHARFKQLNNTVQKNKWKCKGWGGKQIKPYILSRCRVFSSLCQDKRKIAIVQLRIKINQYFPHPRIAVKYIFYNFVSVQSLNLISYRHQKFPSQCKLTTISQNKFQCEALGYATWKLTGFCGLLICLSKCFSTSIDWGMGHSNSYNNRMCLNRRHVLGKEN